MSKTSIFYIRKKFWKNIKWKHLLISIYYPTKKEKAFSGDTVIKNPPANAGDAGDAGSIPGLGR